MAQNAFQVVELESRLTAVHSLMRESDLDGIVVTDPENIYYLTGMDHWGFLPVMLSAS